MAIRGDSGIDRLVLQRLIDDSLSDKRDLLSFVIG
jgi:hypothetical protein